MTSSFRGRRGVSQKMTKDDQEDGYQSLPRIGGTSQGTRSRHGYNSLNVHQNGTASAGHFQRGYSASHAGQQLPVIRQAENLDENRVVLYKRSKQLGAGYYIVEISTNNTHLFIAAFDVESPESLLIELPEKKAQDILKEFQNDYEQMASSLQVMNKRLVLLNPKFIQQRRIGTAPADFGGRPKLV